jgi:cardiolipin synthase A/B
MVNKWQKDLFSKTLPIIFGLVIGGGSSGAFAIPVDVSNAPDSALSLTVNAIQSATKSIWMNIYELDAPEIQDAIVAQVENGIEVQILEEGEPAGGFLKGEVTTRTAILDAMKESSANSNDHFFMMQKPSNGSERRFHYDHAKYTLIDGTNLLIGSENYSPTGNPVAGKKGNRGWEVFVHDNTTSAKFVQTFQSDTDTSYGDIVDMVTSSHTKKPKKPKKPQKPNTPSNDTVTANYVSLDVDSISSFTSPDTSEDGLVSLISGTTSKLEIELMTFTSDWGGAGKVSPMLAAIEKISKANKTVRVLLNDSTVFDGGDHSKTKTNQNLTTVNDINKYGSDTQAVIADIKAMGVDYIHNKGMLVDGNKVLISSINWDENSVEHNREAAVVLEGTDVYAYYENLFNNDWQDSVGNQH